METPPSDAKAPAPSGTRLVSIDALRGSDMFWIIGGGKLVSSLAKVSPNRVTLTLQEQLRHVRWLN